MVTQSEYLRNALNKLVEAGWTITGHDATNDGSTEAINTVADAMEAAISVDECHIFVAYPPTPATPRGMEGWLYAVWQGPDATYKNGYEIIADYTINLDRALNPMQWF